MMVPLPVEMLVAEVKPRLAGLLADSEMVSIIKSRCCVLQHDNIHITGLLFLTKSPLVTHQGHFKFISPTQCTPEERVAYLWILWPISPGISRSSLDSCIQGPG